MKSPWQKVFDAASTILEDPESEHLLFRGQSDDAWKLLPSLARCSTRLKTAAEQAAYFDFVTRGGSLLKPDATGWDYLFAMQHHGIPTRLLDWTDSFGVALYFAMKNATRDCAVWVLDPFELNRLSMALPAIVHPQELKCTFDSVIVDKTHKAPGSIVAICPVRIDGRINLQKSSFTLHFNYRKPLEALFPTAIRKITIPSAAFPDARRFLRLAGISEYSLFPDLDGLGRELVTEHFV